MSYGDIAEGVITFHVVAAALLLGWRAVTRSRPAGSMGRITTTVKTIKQRLNLIQRLMQTDNVL